MNTITTYNICQVNKLHLTANALSRNTSDELGTMNSQVYDTINFIITKTFHQEATVNF